MLNKMIELINSHEGKWEKYKHMFQEIDVPAKTLLLREGDTSKHLYFVKKGCLRTWLSNDGGDVTFQFFFENQAISTLGEEKVSAFNIESIEASTILIIKISDFQILLNEIPGFKDGFIIMLMRRMQEYGKLFIFRIMYKPEERYRELVKNNPQIIKRVPLQYVASYLGINKVSLSRIRKRI